MRIIAGQRRGHKIDGPRASALMRPTSDLVRESLFNMVGPMMAGRLAIDLFAGTGAVGLEALSRARHGQSSSRRTARASPSFIATSPPCDTRTAPRSSLPTPIVGCAHSSRIKTHRWLFFSILPTASTRCIARGSAS